MTRADPALRPGILVLLDFTPVRGSEQDGTRPALVISEAGMHEMTRRAIVCPITRNTRPWPSKVMLPGGLGAEGAVLVDQVRSIDGRERILRTLGAVPSDILLQVRRKVAALIGIDFIAGANDRAG